MSRTEDMETLRIKSLFLTWLNYSPIIPYFSNVADVFFGFSGFVRLFGLFWLLSASADVF